MQPKSFMGGLLFLAVVLVALAGLVSGCRRPDPAPPPPAFQGAALTVACPEGPAAAAVRAHARGWAARQQATVEVVAYDPAKGPGATRADVWVVAPADLPRHAAAGALLPVPKALTTLDSPYDWAGVLPPYRDQLLLWDGQEYALALLGEAPVCVYRADLFADPARKKKYPEFVLARRKARGDPAGRAAELRPPATWEEFADLAEYFQAHHPSGKFAPSLPPLPDGEAALDRLFYQVAASYVRRGVRADEPQGADHVAEVFTFHFDAKTGQPRIAADGFVTALKLLRRLQACRPGPATLLAASKGPFRAGAVLGLADASCLVALQKDSALRDRVGVCAVPGAGQDFPRRAGDKRAKEATNTVPYLGGAGWLAAVPKGAGNPEAAFDLLAHLTGPAQSGQMALEPRWGGGPTRLQQLGRERWDAFDLDDACTAGLKEALNKALLQHGLKNPALVLRTPDQAAYRAALGRELRAALAGDKEPAEALAQAAKRWQELVEKRGAARHREEYRLSLGLLAR